MVVRAVISLSISTSIPVQSTEGFVDVVGGEASREWGSEHSWRVFLDELDDL
jgi:hypothetical protein